MNFSIYLQLLCKFKLTVLPLLCSRLPLKKKHSMTHWLCCFPPLDIQYNYSITAHVISALIKSTSWQSPLTGPHFIAMCLWVTQAKQPVCLHWPLTCTHTTCQHGQNRVCSKLIMSRLCSLFGGGGDSEHYMSMCVEWEKSRSCMAAKLSWSALS